MATTINLVQKFHDRLVKSLDYYSNLEGKTTDEYKMEGSEGIYLTSLVPVPLNNYNMAATANRYGTPTEMGDEQQFIGWDYDKSFSVTVDNANYRDGGFMKTVDAVTREQQESEVAPFIESNFYAKLSKYAGKVITGTAPTSADILSRLTAIEAAFRNARIPKKNRYVVMGTSNVQLIRSSLTNLDNITDKMLLKGVVGAIGSLKVLEAADDDLPTGVNFLAWYKGSAVKAFDIKEGKAHDNPPGINGALIEYRVRGVNAVVGKYSGGVIADVLSSAKAASPTISAAGAIGKGNAGYTQAYIYTLDGTDPRYSKTAVRISTNGSNYTPAFTGTVTIKAVQEESAAYGRVTLSDVVTATVTAA